MMWIVNRKLFSCFIYSRLTIVCTWLGKNAWHFQRSFIYLLLCEITRYHIWHPKSEMLETTPNILTWQHAKNMSRVETERLHQIQTLHILWKITINTSYPKYYWTDEDVWGNHGPWTVFQRPRSFRCIADLQQLWVSSPYILPFHST